MDGQVKQEYKINIIVKKLSRSVSNKDITLISLVEI